MMTPQSSPIDLAVLSRYLGGTAEPADLAAVEAWAAGDPERRAALTALREAWVADARRLAAPYSVDAAWARVAARAGLTSGAAAEPRRWGGAWRRGAIAAAIVVAVVGGGAAWWISGARPAGPPAMRDSARAAGGVSPAGRDGNHAQCRQPPTGAGHLRAAPTRRLPRWGRVLPGGPRLGPPLRGPHPRRRGARHRDQVWHSCLQ